MTNIFPQDHLFTRLLAEAEAAEAARLAEAKRKSLAAAEREAELTETMLTRLAAYMGAEFVDAISPYTVVDYVTDSTFRFILVIPGHRNIHLTFDPDRWLRISGGERAEITPTDMLPFARELRSARDIYQRETQYVTERQTVADAWQQYREEFARISAANDAVLAALQTEYDGDFELYTLEYGVIADDAETGMELTTNNVRVLHGDSDINDRWSVITQAGAVSLRKFFYPISLEGPDYYRASNSQYARPVRVMGYGTVGYVSPLSDDTRVAAYARRAAEMLLPLPAHPDAPEPFDD